MTVWPVQHAKARFSELLDACQREGPQVVSRRGTAKVHQLTVVTRNVGGFSHFEVPLLNPFTSHADLSRYADWADYCGNDSQYVDLGITPQSE